MKYVHIKTGNIYRHLAIAVDATNERDGLRVVVYCPDDNEHTIYVREQEEFYTKFKIMGTDEITPETEKVQKSAITKMKEAADGYKKTRDLTLYITFKNEYNNRYGKYVKNSKDVNKPKNIDIYRYLFKNGFGHSVEAIRKHYKRVEKQMNETKELILNCWSVTGDAYSAPECRTYHLSGYVFNHSRFPDGYHITTSQIVALQDGKVVTKSGSVYTLGEVDPEYEKAFPNAEERLFISIKAQNK